MEFQEFLLEKLHEYETSKGHRITQKEFAEYLGVKRPILTLWLNGKIIPSYESAIILAEKLGPQIFDILYFRRNEIDHNIREFSAIYQTIPPDKQDELIELVKHWADEHGYSVIDETPPTASPPAKSPADPDPEP